MLDTTVVTIKSGKWGDGCVAARREAGVPFGGPAGWDGGKWGNVIFKASKDEQTLAWFRHHNKIEAQDGQDGMIKDMYGANADDKIVIVPIGTIVKNMESGHILFQFTKDQEKYIVAKGGKWGAGNIHFKNPINQYPTFALKGEPGQEFIIWLELQMLGDVGLIGTPSVGKSSIINTCCATKAKTAEYHFTTLQPNIGICDTEGTTFSMVDIPGVVEGASAGKWLGNEFLRHILKARIFALVVDMDSYEASFDKLTTVFDEIILYIHQRFVGSTEFGEPIESVTLELKGEDGYIILECIVQIDGKTELLFQKAIQIVANKYDMVNDKDISKEFVQALAAHIQSHFQTKRGRSVSTADLLKNTFVVSAATHEGISLWTQALARMIKDREIKHIFLFDTVATETITHERITDVTENELDKLIEYWYLDNSSSRAKVWEIRDPEICRLTNILPRWNEQAEYRYRNVMMKKKYLSDFEKVGMMHGDIMKIKSYYTGHDDRYIMYV
jgi:Obg family GTPase CgtA